MKQTLEPRRPARKGLHEGASDPLGEDLARTLDAPAPEPSYAEPDPDLPAMGGKVQEVPLITAVNLPRTAAAGRTGCAQLPRAGQDDDLVQTDQHPFDDEAGRPQRG